MDSIDAGCAKPSARVCARPAAPVYHRTVPLAAVTLALSLATAGDSLVLDAPPAPSSWRVPVAHAAGVLAGMRIAVGLAWPTSYDPSRFGEAERRVLGTGC